MVLSWQCDKDSRLKLTSQEEKIARLAAEGCSNSEIARLIGVSKRTVDKALYLTYGKLNISNKVQLMLLKLEKTNLLSRCYRTSLVNLNFALFAYKKAALTKQKRLRIALAINHLKYKCRCNQISSEREWLKELDKLIEVVVHELNDF